LTTVTTAARVSSSVVIVLELIVKRVGGVS